MSLKLHAGIKGALRVLKDAQLDHSKLTAIGKRGAVLLLRDSLRAFSEQADPSTGAKWKPSQRALGLARSKWTRRAPGRGQTLLDSGILRKSVATDYHLVAGLGTNAVEILGGTLPLAYARIHQFGGACGRGHRTILGARPYVGFSRDSTTALSEAITRHYGGRRA